MLKIKLVVVGNIKEKYFTDAIIEYKKRLSRFVDLEIQELQEGSKQTKSNVEEIKKFESDLILKAISGYIIVLDRQGTMVSSEDIAEIIDTLSVQGSSKITFVIGGSHGVDDRVLKAANKKISFGKVTYPHQLMRVILLEQIYRAETILNNITYHK